MSEELMSSAEVKALEIVHGEATAEENLPTIADPESLSRERRIRLFELCLVLLVAFGGYFLSSFYVLAHDHVSALPSQFQNFQWMDSVVRESAALLLLGYILRRRRLNFRDLGLRLSRHDPFTGLLLAIGFLAAYWLGHLIVYSAYHAVTTASPGGATARQLFSHPSWIAFPFIILNAFFEELIVRAYLMTEIKELTGSWTLATVTSVAVQTSYHLYYGWVGALSLSFGFLLISIYFAKTRRAVPMVVGHALVDIYSFISLL